MPGFGPSQPLVAHSSNSGLGFIVLLVIVGVTIFVVRRNSKKRAAIAAREALEPAKKLAYEDVTALGEQLQALDIDMAGKDLDEGARADYQRGLDAYESAKVAADAMTSADDISNVTRVLDDGRYAISCVRARVSGQPLPTRRPPCFFDPRHGISARDVPWMMPNGQMRDVPACELDAQRVIAGAEPDTRQVMVGSRRVPYWQGGPGYRGYAQGYFGGFGFMDWMFMGMAFNMFGEGVGLLAEGLGSGIGDIAGGLGDIVGGIGDGIGDLFNDF
ncbi:MAG: hypothetical protein NVS3B1_02940 [Marmoricola sp.]